MGYEFIGDATTEYEKALKLGKKDKDTVVALDDILKEKNISATREYPLGVVQIPIDQIAGTKTAGRSSAFSSGFYPLLKSNTEFAYKWIELYKAHITEGIREPIKAYEFMNKFYIQEGNKRVSVMKYSGAVSIPGNVTRIVPPRSEDKETKIYYEFMDFYSVSNINYIWFSELGSFAKLQRRVGKRPDQHWTDDDKLEFSSVYNRFSAEYLANGGEKFPITIGDAFLTFIKIYDYTTLDDLTNAELKEKVLKVWDEFPLLTTDKSVKLQMDPTIEGDVKKNILTKFLTNSNTNLKVAFIHEKTAETSGWTYAHELGRMHIQQTFKDQITTSVYENATAENGYELLTKAIEDGNTLIFTTTPPLLDASLKAAIEHPEVKILNCSLNNSHHHVRTYYARMYEAKFLMGAIAGAFAENNKIGYIADYPIYGMIANINAFALGAKMVNPRAKVYLEWSTIKDRNAEQELKAKDIKYISGRDIIIPGEECRHFGLYIADNSPLNVAMPIWHWGKFYEQMVRNIMNGSWKYDDVSDATKGLNYWWGMSTSLIDVIHSKHLPIGTARLIALLKDTICKGDFNPFSGVLFSQDGIIQKDPHKVMSPEEIVEMDWLAENIIGYIPKMEDLIDKAIPVVLSQGVDK